MNKTKFWIGRGIKNVILVIFSLFCVFPLIWVLIAATNTSVDIVSGVLVPGKNIVANFQTLSEHYDVFGASWNTIKYSAVCTVAAIVVCSIAGYGFEIYHDKVKDKLFGLLMLTMMIPFVATMLPLYQSYAKLGLLNSTLGFILPQVSTVFLIMLFRQNSRTFPKDIIEAARIDGETELGIFFKMFMPTMKATYAAGATIMFMNAWNNFMCARLIMSDNSAQTLPMMISNITTGHYIDYGMLMLAVLISTLPTLIVFFALQKSFVQGMTGAVKG